MNKVQFWSALVLTASWLSVAIESACGAWTNGISTAEDYFPLGVWLQRPEDASAWRAAGINLYTGLWEGPTSGQLNTLQAAGMQTICPQNSVSLNYSARLSDGRPVIVGWLMPDEPDNAQPDGQGGYGRPISPTVIQQEYQRLKIKDPTRPVLLNLGEGIGWDSATWTGQGGYIKPNVDYPRYILGSDIISFDIYPMSSNNRQVAGMAWRVALGLDRLRRYAPINHPIWTFIETTDIRGIGKKATPSQIRAQVWMALIHGATGVNYFVHGRTSLSFFDDRALLRSESAAELAALTSLNREVQSLAAVLKLPSVSGLVTAANADGPTWVDLMVKTNRDSTYLFAVGMDAATATNVFQFHHVTSGEIEVIGEKRRLSLTNGMFTDTFRGYEAHLYRRADPSQNLSLGNRVWDDSGAGGGVRDNGIQDGTEAGIDGVTLLLVATNDAGVPLGSPLQTNTTAAGGYYRFDGLAKGSYRVIVPTNNFKPGGPLANKQSSETSLGPAFELDPDDSPLDLDSNGDLAISPAITGVHSTVISMGLPEPTGETDLGPRDNQGSDTSANLTVDFGFVTLASSPIQLAYFKGSTVDGHVTIEWATVSELKAAGFDLYRVAIDGIRYRINPTFLQAAKGPGGRHYQVIDAIIKPPAIVTYELVEIETTGKTNTLGPLLVMARALAEGLGGRLTTNGFEIRLIGEPEADYQVEMIDVLSNRRWFPLQRIRTDPTGLGNLFDRVGNSQRFYRAWRP